MNRHGESYRRCESGLTLIEVLVGLVLLGALVAVLSGSLRLGMLGRETVDARAEWLDELRITQRFMRRAMETARPISWYRDRRSVAAFDGAREQVSFISAMPGWQSPGGLYQVRIGREGDALVMTRRITSGGETRFGFADHAERTILASGIKGLEFSYFGRAQISGTQARWHDEWRDQSAAPRLLMLDVAYEDERKGPWPVLVIEMMIDRQPR